VYEPGAPATRPRGDAGYEPGAPATRPRGDAVYEPGAPATRPRGDAGYEPGAPATRPRGDAVYEPGAPATGQSEPERQRGAGPEPRAPARDCPSRPVSVPAVCPSRAVLGPVDPSPSAVEGSAAEGCRPSDPNARRQRAPVRARAAARGRGGAASASARLSVAPGLRAPRRRSRVPPGRRRGAARPGGRGSRRAAARGEARPPRATPLSRNRSRICLPDHPGRGILVVSAPLCAAGGAGGSTLRDGA